MRFRPPIEAERAGLQLAPMIDIVFLLLIFFIVTYNYAHFETTLEVQVPVAQEGQEPSPRSVGEIILNVRTDGAIILEGQIISDPDLLARLQRIKNVYGDVAIILRGDESTNFKNIVRVLDICARAQIFNVSFATSRPEDRDP